VDLTVPVNAYFEETAMDLFQKLPGYHQAPAGLERKILRLIPRVFLIGTALIAAPSMLARMMTWSSEPYETSKLITTIDIYAFGLLSVLWTALFTVGLGAFIVMVMKGPAYVADAYPLSDAEQPKSDTEFSNPLPHHPHQP
jgi:hypothetical protein